MPGISYIDYYIPGGRISIEDMVKDAPDIVPAEFDSPEAYISYCRSQLKIEGVCCEENCEDWMMPGQLIE